MFTLPKKLHFYVNRLLLNVSIGVRLFSLIGLAASVSLLLAVAGILGLGAAKESLQSVYEHRMLLIQQLGEIANLMLNNRVLLHKALGDVVITTSNDSPHPKLAMKQSEANLVADTIEENITRINALWQRYALAPLQAQERSLANQFAKSQESYIQQALIPAVLALRSNNYEQTKVLATNARLLYDLAAPDLQALSQLQFVVAQEAYATGIQRYESTRLMAIITLATAILVMLWLGLILTTSIVNPLKQVISIFKNISCGHYDTLIHIQGQDEISKVMLALRKMQAKLGVDEKAIHQLAFYDPLTNLPNRRLLRDRLQRALSISTRNHLYGAILMIDLDNFKTINDTLGHDVGDRFLEEIAIRIQSCIRQADTVARMGGDEFIVMLTDLSQNEAKAAVYAESIGEKILNAINLPCMLADQLQHGSASMGLCLFLGQNITLEDLLKRADIAMYQAKNSGRNALRFYDPLMQTSLESRIALESELREALPNNQLKLYYQIQVDKKHGVLGAEVLLRWQHPKHGLVPPDQFISIAEESGLIVPIGIWVLGSACEQLSIWATNRATEHFALSVNVSARQFRHPDFAQMVCTIVQETGIDPKKLKLELTESLVLHDITDTIAKMKVLNQHGIHFSMDDFGTGYSSLAHLTNLPIQQLKIDRSFVCNITQNPSDAIIVQTIIGMAKNLGISVIAEGVESEQQRACLERFGCLTYQGYLYGRPMPLNEFEELGAHFGKSEQLNCDYSSLHISAV